ncbi:hypothetical protein EI74_0348 [Mycoplasma testudineum]|uniref:Uncharacterized protein n=1 Tax=Mycoplasma testudineum TaxID=244584 RepID=A0A4R6IE13_9MOLU|nr:hypothetical protein [Mycoplasma testudineum]OYD26966.1 hypothetical protein CG473_01360 [Mycoplasma testudineum]TDO20513.1 hypothetical protein EI74_0348 [Mycoplasma testudineum]
MNNNNAKFSFEGHRKLTELQKLIISFIGSESKSFQEIFEMLEVHFNQKWTEQANEFGIDYEKLLIKKRGEIYTYLIADGNVSVISDNNEFRWINKNEETI